jgi:hypothetical protein
MRRTWLLHVGVVLFALPLLAQSPTQSAPVAAQSDCPIAIQHFNPGAVSVKIKNLSGKLIVGIVFNAALADATEHWKWLHWDFDQDRSLRNFSWNRQIKQDAIKTLTWSSANLDFEHGGGGAFVLTSVLFEDGSSWESPEDSATCKYLWYNNHKKSFLKPVILPWRE